jgi:hypothetical protein
VSEPDRVTYELLVSTGDYSHIKIGITTNVRDAEECEDAIERARKTVRKSVKADFKKMGDLRGYATDDDEKEAPP